MKYKAAVCVLALFGLLPGTSSALEFNFNPEPGMDQEAIDGFQAAGALWEGLYRDDVKINMDIGFRDLGPQTLAETGSDMTTVSYNELRTALTNDNSSPDDQDAIASLPAGAALDMLLNRTQNSPQGPGSAVPFLEDDGDANNTTIRLTRANAKAIGLIAGDQPDSDASITFNSEFNWDFDPSDGVDPNSFNFIFVAAHEIGHALGFVSGVDILDGNSPPVGGPFADHVFTYVSTVDVYRFSNQSFGQGAGTIDWTADQRGKFFATDGGATNNGGFSTGQNFGDGRQASHWQDNLGLGIMDPTAGTGEIGQITALDQRLFDVIGYDPGVEDIVLCRDTAADIPDNDSTGITDTLSVTDSRTLSDLDVIVVADHTWIGDLVFVLEHQDTNTQVTLIDRPGVTGGGFGCRGDNVDATLDDAAANPVETACASATPTIDGTFLPQQALQAFVNEQVTGTWTLTLSDNASQDTGRLVRWCLVAG